MNVIQWCRAVSHWLVARTLRRRVAEVKAGLFLSLIPVSVHVVSSAVFARTNEDVGLSFVLSSFLCLKLLKFIKTVAGRFFLPLQIGENIPVVSEGQMEYLSLFSRRIVCLIPNLATFTFCLIRKLNVFQSSFVHY